MGTSQPEMTPWGDAQQPAPLMPRNGLGVASAILGVISVVTLVVLIGPFVGVAAITTGILALIRVRRAEANKRGMAIVGIVLGLLSLLAALVVIGIFGYVAVEQSKTGCWPAKQHTGCY